MFARIFRRLPMPKSLRWQFMLALSTPALLIIAGGIIAVYDCRISSDATRQLADVRVLRLQQSQTLAQCTFLIERESHRLLTAGSLDSMQASYGEILKRLDVLDSLVLRLGQASNDLSVLALNQADQLFRNTVHIVAQLRKNLLTKGATPPASANQKAMRLHFQDELQRQAKCLTGAIGRLSAHFTLDYQEAMRQGIATSAQHQRRLLALFTGNAVLAWLVFRYFLSRRIAARLQQVSNCLRLGETSAELPQVPVQGDDEIGEIARAVEQFLEDRRLLVQTQHDLRQNEEILQAVIEAASVAIIGLDLEGNVHSIWNRAAERMLGWSAREVMDRPLSTVLAQSEAELRRFREQVRSGMNLDGVEVRRKKRDGTPVDCSVYASPLHDPEGKISGNILVLVDITEKKQAEAALRFEREQLLSIFDSIDELVSVSDPQTYEILYVNQAVKTAFQKDLTGGICHRDIRGFDAPCRFCTNNDIFLPPPFPYHWEYYNPTIERYLHVSDRVITWPDGRDVKLSFAVDITKRKILEDRLRRKNEELARSNAELDDFAYIVSHDLKEPLRSIRSFSSFLREDYRDRLELEGRTHLDIVMQSATRMEALLDDLLLFSRVGRAELAIKPTDLGRIVAGLLEEMRPLLAEQNAHVTVAEDLPTVICDHVRIQVVFRNLLQNAMKYNDGEEKQIEVGWYPGETAEKGAPVFFVRDNGIGIREKHLKIVFKIFKRLHGRDQYGGGSGSGLTIVRKIVERHGGRIWGESQLGRGSTFYFTLGAGSPKGEPL